MRYPLPYAFARGQQLLLEQAEDGSLTLCMPKAPPRSALGEVLRKYPVKAFEPLPPEQLAQRISAACSARFGCTTSRSVPSMRKRTEEVRS